METQVPAVEMVKSGRRATDPLVPVTAIPGMTPESSKETPEMATRSRKQNAPRNPNSPDPTDPFGLHAKSKVEGDSQASEGVVHSGVGNVAEDTTENTMTEQAQDTQAQAETADEKKARIAQEKADAKAKKDAEKAEKAAAAQAAKEAEKAKKEAEKQAAKEAKAAEAAAALAAKIEAEKEAGSKRTYFGSMTTLADRVKQGAYVKGTNGQLRSNDELAVALEACSPKNVIELALKVLQDAGILVANPYTALNIGQQSMNLRNKLRGAIRGGKITIDAVKAIRDEGGFADAEDAARQKREAQEARKAEREAKAKVAAAEREAKAKAKAAAEPAPAEAQPAA